jgi:hypothetical protein
LSRQVPSKQGVAQINVTELGEAVASNGAVGLTVRAPC